MKYIILAVIGLIIAIAGGIYLAQLLYYKKNGVMIKAEVVKISEIKKRTILWMIGSIFAGMFKYGKKTDSYAHTMRYELNGKTYEEKDREGYNQPFDVGSVHYILCDPKKPSRFKFETGINSSIKLVSVLVALGILFAVRFFILASK